jgi:hypothetical protein
MTILSHSITPTREIWPALPLAEWKDTYATLHMWTQIVGKVRMELSPRVNHWWHVPLHVDVRGLTTSPIPLGSDWFSISFDFLDHRLVLDTTSGQSRTLSLKAQPVAEFYNDFMKLLTEAGILLTINTMPVEVRNPIPFPEDTVHASYDREYVQRFWRTLLTITEVFQEFRGRFLGKCSPVHFFWGSFDLAVTRFSGRRAPERPGADAITREAYSHEVSSAGWWPGGETANGLQVPGATFYSYMSPEPAGYAEQAVGLPAHYDPTLGEYVLPYDDLRREASPHSALLNFLQTTYEAGAVLAHWDRTALEEPKSWLRPEEQSAA